MRALRRFPPPAAARGLRADAWLALFALLVPFLTQAFHGATPLAALAGSRGGQELALAASDAAAAALPHDVHGCPLCRAAAHSRLALRAAHAGGELAPAAKDPRWRLAAPPRAPAEPALGSAWSRAPPASSLLQTV